MELKEKRSLEKQILALQRSIEKFGDSTGDKALILRDKRKELSVSK